MPSSGLPHQYAPVRAAFYLPIDEEKVRFTMAAMMTTVPRRQGLRKWTESTLAVTQGPRARDFADIPAQTSIQLSTCSSE